MTGEPIRDREADRIARLTEQEAAEAEQDAADRRRNGLLLVYVSLAAGAYLVAGGLAANWVLVVGAFLAGVRMAFHGWAPTDSPATGPMPPALPPILVKPPMPPVKEPACPSPPSTRCSSKPTPVQIAVAEAVTVADRVAEDYSTEWEP